MQLVQTLRWWILERAENRLNPATKQIETALVRLEVLETEQVRIVAAGRMMKYLVEETRDGLYICLELISVGQDEQFLDLASLENAAITNIVNSKQKFGHVTSLLATADCNAADEIMNLDSTPNVVGKSSKEALG